MPACPRATLARSSSLQWAISPPSRAGATRYALRACAGLSSALRRAPETHRAPAWRARAELRVRQSGSLVQSSVCASQAGAAQLGMRQAGRPAQLASPAWRARTEVLSLPMVGPGCTPAWAARTGRRSRPACPPGLARASLVDPCSSALRAPRSASSSPISALMAQHTELCAQSSARSARRSALSARGTRPGWPSRTCTLRTPPPPCPAPRPLRTPPGHEASACRGTCAGRRRRAARWTASWTEKRR